MRNLFFSIQLPKNKFFITDEFHRAHLNSAAFYLLAKYLTFLFFSLLSSASLFWRSGYHLLMSQNLHQHLSFLFFSFSESLSSFFFWQKEYLRDHFSSHLFLSVLFLFLESLKFLISVYRHSQILQNHHHFAFGLASLLFWLEKIMRLYFFS